MTTLLQDIKSRDWQISTQGVGLVAEGLGDIRQCLDIILRTTKGTDPLRPEFGSDIFQFADKPLNIAIPNIKKAIIEATQIWEKRVSLVKVDHQVSDNTTVNFFVTYKPVDQELIDLISLQLDNGSIVIDTRQIGTLTIYALFPPNPSGKRYQVGLITEGTDALPAPPTTGFASTIEMYNWIRANWSGYGSWSLGADRIIGVLRPGILTASISISLSGTLLFSASVPDIPVGGHIKVLFAPDGVAMESAVFPNVGQMISWLQSNWNRYGTWGFTTTPGAVGDFDAGDFDAGDFSVGNLYGYTLQLNTNTVASATLQVENV